MEMDETGPKTRHRHRLRCLHRRGSPPQTSNDGFENRLVVDDSGDKKCVNCSGSLALRSEVDLTDSPSTAGFCFTVEHVVQTVFRFQSDEIIGRRNHLFACDKCSAVLCTLFVAFRELSLLRKEVSSYISERLVEEKKKVTRVGSRIRKAVEDNGKSSEKEVGVSWSPLSSSSSSCSSSGTKRRKYGTRGKNLNVKLKRQKNKSTPKDKSSKRKAPAATSTKKAVPCEVCGKTFLRLDQLCVHRRIHTGEKPHACLDCGKSFSDPRGLAFHSVIHNKDRPFCCLMCGMTFKRSHHLRDHEKNHDSNCERPFSCDLCDKRFKWKKHLIAHFAIHKTTREHRCESCSRAFTRKDNLLQHVRNVHKKGKCKVGVPTDEVNSLKDSVLVKEQFVETILPDTTVEIIYLRV